MSKQRGLGRGFDSLIPTQLDVATAKKVGVAQAETTQDSVLQLEPSQITPNPHQPRKHFQEQDLADLAASIREHGVLQPLVVTALDNGDYELIAGERRLRASKLAGLKKVPAIVRSFDDQQKLELAIIENVQRAELNPVETALAYQKLADEFNLSLDQISQKVGKAKSTVSNLMRLLQLPNKAQAAIASGDISEAHGRAILALSDADLQHQMLEKIMADGMTVRQAEQYGRDMKQQATTRGNIQQSPAQAKRKSGIDQVVLDELTQAFGMVVTQQPTAKGGKLVLRYTSDDDIQRIQAIARELIRQKP